MNAFLMSIVLMLIVTIGAYLGLGAFEMSAQDVFVEPENVRLDP